MAEELLYSERTINDNDYLTLKSISVDFEGILMDSLHSFETLNSTCGIAIEDIEDVDKYYLDLYGMNSKPFLTLLPSSDHAFINDIYRMYISAQDADTCNCTLYIKSSDDNIKNIIPITKIDHGSVDNQPNTLHDMLVIGIASKNIASFLTHYTFIINDVLITIIGGDQGKNIAIDCQLLYGVFDRDIFKNFNFVCIKASTDWSLKLYKAIRRYETYRYNLLTCNCQLFALELIRCVSNKSLTMVCKTDGAIEFLASPSIPVQIVAATWWDHFLDCFIWWKRQCKE
jgi:hypothetical protein